MFLALFLLGLIQGLTEFLPVSSSGHLVLFSKIMGVEESLFLSILLHVATLLSVVIVFYKDVFYMIRYPFSKQTISLAVATIPTCIIVLILMPIIKKSFSGFMLPICFLISAVLLFLTETITKKHSQAEMNYKTAFIMGIAQGFAVFPGISRSGSTICAGLLCNKNKSQVAKFSFLMSLPIIFLSLIMEIYEIITGGIVFNFSIWAMSISFLVAFIVGVIAIKIMINLVAKSNLKWFSFYLLFISILTFFI